MLVDEAREAADGARRQIDECSEVLRALGARLRATPPRFVITCARGSSDHAASYGKYVLETHVGRVVASVGPSVASMYRAPLAVDGALLIAVSQSGRSPDLIELVRAARQGGALTVAFVNDAASPLAEACEVVVPLGAGPERAVAATKSYLLSCFAFLQLAAAWSEDAELVDIVAATPDALAAAAALDWSAMLGPLATARSAYVLARGVGLGCAQELALKLKETCALHAEAFSTAEVLHGPIELVGPGFAVIALGQADETEAAAREVLTRFVDAGATVWSTLAAPGVQLLPTPPRIPAVLAPLCAVQTAYLALPSIAAARGRDADAPAHLAKVTKTS